MNTDVFRDEYVDLFKKYWRDGDEESLTRAADLGKRLVHDELPPEDIGEFEQYALRAIGSIAPPDTLDSVAARLTLPLIEVLMAYGLTFRQQLQEHYDALVEKNQEQTSKLEALGTLSSGIAHDFNTLLGVILGYVEMTIDLVPQDGAAAQNLQQVITATQRARDLVARILAFGRRDEKRKIPVRLADSLRECLALLRATVPPGVSIRTHVDDPDLAVLGDPNECQQLIMDLTMNAIDAIAGRGHITFSLDQVALGIGMEPLQPELMPGRYVRLRIRDTGCGVPAQIADRIFEPFFTTKDVGHGTGLGLSVVYGIVKRMGGIIRLNRTPGQGAEFEILCPCYMELIENVL